MNSREELVYRFGGLPERPLVHHETALLVIDMQYLVTHPTRGLAARVRERGFEDAYEYFRKRLEIIVPNIQRLITAFRHRKMEVIYTVVESLTKDGRERSLEHKHLDALAVPGSKGSQILEEIAPADNEIVLKKTCSSVFNGAPIHYVLGNLGIRTLVVCGVVTGGCVETAVRDASDLSYNVVVVDDGCATWSQEMHEASIYAVKEIYAKIHATKDILKKLNVANDV